MIGREEGTSTFWDRWVLERLIPPDHLLMRIDRAVDFGFVEEETRDLYAPHTGRPAYPPEKLFRVLLIAYLYGLSDVRVAEELRYNLLYRAFCRFPLEGPTPDDTTLVVFRRRLGAERFQRLFDRIVAQAREKGVLVGGRKVVDATVIRAEAAVRNRRELLREGRRRLLRVLARACPDKAAELACLEQAFVPAEAGEAGALAAEEEATERLLTASAPLAREGEAAMVHDALKKVLSGEGGVASFVDPEARWGFQRKDKPFFGYKAHAAQDASGLVTSVQLLPGNASEGRHLPELLCEEQQKDIPAKSVVADKAYDSEQNRSFLRQAGLEPEIPARNPNKLAFRFRYRPRKDTFICPAGKESRGKSPHRRGGFVYLFSQSDCARCLLRTACLSPGRTRQMVYLSPRAREELTRRQDLTLALKERKAIERKFGEAKRWHGLARARYLGLARVRIQVLLTFLVMNLKLMARLLTARPVAATG